MTWLVIGAAVLLVATAVGWLGAHLIAGRSLLRLAGKTEDSQLHVRGWFLFALVASVYIPAVFVALFVILWVGSDDGWFSSAPTHDVLLAMAVGGLGAFVVGQSNLGRSQLRHVYLRTSTAWSSRKWGDAGTALVATERDFVLHQDKGELLRALRRIGIGPQMPARTVVAATTASQPETRLQSANDSPRSNEPSPPTAEKTGGASQLVPEHVVEGVASKRIVRKARERHTKNKGPAFANADDIDRAINPGDVSAPHRELRSQRGTSCTWLLSP
jgi:hypothetical protein